MIDGIKFEVGGNDLREHLKARAKWYADQVDAADKAIEENRTARPRSEYLQQRRICTAGAAAFAWMAEHLFADTYCLSLDDLRMLEIVEQ